MVGFRIVLKIGAVCVLRVVFDYWIRIDQALSYVALEGKDINLDDGVKDNYMLLQGKEISNEGEKKQTIDLLAKI